MTISRIVLRVAPTSLLAVALACSDFPTTSRPDASTHVAITQLDGIQPALFVGRVDGSGRTRIHFTTVADSIRRTRARACSRPTDRRCRERRRRTTKTRMGCVNVSAIEAMTASG